MEWILMATLKVGFDYASFHVPGFRGDEFACRTAAMHLSNTNADSRAICVNAETGEVIIYAGGLVLR